MLNRKVLNSINVIGGWKLASKYALLVGTSQFDDRGLKTLYAPEEDVTRFRDVLLDKDLSAFDDVKIFMNSSMSAVRTAVANLFADRADDDMVLFYYSGHGLTDVRGRLYFSLPDTDSEEPSTRSLEATFVRQQMDDSNSLRQIIILDCCHSGAFNQGVNLLPREAKTPMLSVKTFEPKGHGRFVLSASAASESSFEKDGKSVYTQTLIEGLQSGDAAPEKSEITVADLHNYLSKKIKAKKAPMRPHFWADSQTDPLVISNNPNVIVPIDKAIKEALSSDNSMARLGAVAELRKVLTTGSQFQRDEALSLLKERQEDPDEVKKVLDAATEAVENLLPIAKLAHPKPDRSSLLENINEEGTADSLAIARLGGHVENSGRGRLTAALQSSGLAFLSCLIFYLVPILFGSSDLFEVITLISFPLLLGVVIGFEMWRRQIPPKIAIWAAVSFVISGLVLIVLLGLGLNSMAKGGVSDSVAGFLVGVAFTGAATLGGALGVIRLRKLKFALLVFLVGVLGSSVMAISISGSMRPTDFIIIFSPLCSIVIFLIFSFSEFTDLRPVWSSLRNQIHRWNTTG